METARSNRSPVVATPLNLNDGAVHSNQLNEAELRRFSLAVVNLRFLLS